MKSRFRNTIAVALVVGGATLAGCSSKEETHTFTGEEIAQGMMGVGPAAERFGPTSTLKDRLDNTKQALKSSSISVQVLNQNAADLAPQPGDPLPATRLAKRMPTEPELTNLAAQLDTVQIPTEAQFQTLVGYVIDEINRRAPKYLAIFATEMQSGDPARVDKALKGMKRTLVAVFESDELATRTQQDPALAVPGVTTMNTGGGTGAGAGSGAAGPNTNPNSAPADPKANKGFDPVVVPNQLPNKDNSYKWDQYWVGTRAGVGAYVGAAVALAVGIAVWAVAVKGLGPFIPFANAQDQNPGDPLAEEMSVGKITKNFAH